MAQIRHDEEVNVAGSKSRPPRVWRGLPTAILLSVLLIGGSTAAGKLSAGAKDAPTNLSITGPGPSVSSAPAFTGFPAGVTPTGPIPTATSSYAPGDPAAGLPTTTYTPAPGRPVSGPTTGPAVPPVPGRFATPAPGTTTPGRAANGATAAPSWLGTRKLTSGSSRTTPRELRNRKIITTDLLPPPNDGKFHSTVATVPLAVLDRSTWSVGCPVTVAQLRYVTVSFRGFDGAAHTGELLVNAKVATKVVTVFGKLFAAGWPIEQMRIVTGDDLSAPATGDGNNTSAFTCRPVTGSTTTWSMHAYGLAIDVNPFHNPYVSGRTVIPELATSYLDRTRWRTGMNARGSVPVRAFASIGWGWGGNYTSKKDWMHFSSNGA